MVKSRETASAQSPPAVPSKNDQKALKKYYLIAYNVLSTLGWTYILLLILFHLFVPSSHSRSSSFARILPSIMSWTKPRIKPALSPIEAYLPKSLLPIFHRTTTLYTQVGDPTAIVQSAAILEILHIPIGIVRSPLQTTVMQVSSRLFLVWGVVEQYPSVRASPIYASMIFSWSLTEVIRYSFYAFSLTAPTHPPPKFLTYLRYTTFYVLYPLGAGSEALLIYFSLPNSSPFKGKWSPYDCFRGMMFLVWWPGLYMMYTHMIKQRGKVFKATKTKAS